MSVVCRAHPRCLPVLLSILAVSSAHADVTLEQHLRVEAPAMMNLIDMNGEVTTTIAGDRSRSDSNIRMESRMMRMFGGGDSIEIVRLDQGKVYQLDPKKKRYTETTFAEQKAQMEESIARMRESQESQQQGATGVDESSCEWSEPTATVDRSGETETIAGHRAERMTVTASQSCADPKSGQVCSFNLLLDQWLAPEFAAGDELAAYYRSYADQLGLDVAGSPDFAQRLESMFGAYEGIWSEIAASMQEAEGYPLRSTVTLAVGGPQCSTGEQAQAAQQSRPGVGEAVGGALGGALGGFLGRRRDQAKEQSAEPAPAAANEDVTLPDGTMKVMSITSELVSVSSDEAPAARFEVPEDYRPAKR